jgi:hypothetical protein
MAECGIGIADPRYRWNLDLPGTERQQHAVRPPDAAFRRPTEDRFELPSDFCVRISKSSSS